LSCSQLSSDGRSHASVQCCQAENGQLGAWCGAIHSLEAPRSPQDIDFRPEQCGRPRVLLGELSRRCYPEAGPQSNSGSGRRWGALCINIFGERSKMSTMTATSPRAGGMTKDERFVILASSLGTVFEWYDFYLYGSLASIIGAQFFSAYPPATRDIFALLAFAAGFLVRPFGAIVFGRVGDIVGRKYTFLVTIMIMGLSTFIVGLLPNAATIGFAAPVILIALRLAQGLALGGEYGGAAT